MARVLWDGYDTYAALANLFSTYAVAVGNLSFTTGRFGGQSLAFSPTSTSNSRPVIGRNVSVDGVSEFTVGTAFYRAQGTADDNIPTLFGWGFYNSGAALSNTPATRQVGWCVDRLGAIRVYRGGSTLIWQSEDGLVPYSAWVYIGFSAVIHPTNGKFALSLNGVQLTEEEGINTQGASDALIRYVMGAAGNLSNSDNMRADDTYYDDEYTSNPPERRVETKYLTADGANLDLVPSTGSEHFSLVNQTLYNATAYLSGSNVGEYDEFEMQDLINVPTEIDGLKVTGWASILTVTLRGMLRLSMG
jgi:hypothetical protein